MYDLSSNRGLYPVINPNWVWCMNWGCTTIVTIPTSSGLWTWAYPYFDPYYIPRLVSSGDPSWLKINVFR